MLKNSNGKFVSITFVKSKRAAANVKLPRHGGLWKNWEVQLWQPTQSDAFCAYNWCAW